MKLPSFLKKKRTYAIFVLLLFAFFWYRSNNSQDSEALYETARVEKHDLQQTVEVTGELKPAARIELAFDRNGTVRTTLSKVGDQVKQGQVLMELEDDQVSFGVRSAAASLAVAQANLQQRSAGETKQAIRIAETNVEKAQAAYDKSISDLAAVKLTSQDAIKTAQLSVDTAKNKFDNQSGSLDQNHANAVQDLKIALLAALGPMQTALTDGDAIIGVDDRTSNASNENILGIYDSNAKTRARNTYLQAKPAKAAAETAVKGIVTSSTEAQIQMVADKLLAANLLIQTYLSDVQKVLSASITGPNLSAADLAAKKALIDGDLVSVSNQNAAVATAVQTLKNVGLTNTDSQQQLRDAYQTALVALSTAQTRAQTDVKTAESNVTIQAAALESAKADFDQKKAPTREVDLAPLRASVEQAQVAYDKALNELKKIQIVSPVDGTISEVLPDIGEQVAPNSPVIRMVGTESYEVEALVPEADIAKVQVGQKSIMTLDAYGDDITFNGSVSAKDPAETKVQDAVYYKIRVQIQPDGREVKPGMTANVTVQTQEVKDALVIPSRAIRTDIVSKETSVRILENDQPKDVTVKIGLRGDEGRVEIKEGLADGQTVIVSEKK